MLASCDNGEEDALFAALLEAVGATAGALEGAAHELVAGSAHAREQEAVPNEQLLEGVARVLVRRQLEPDVACTCELRRLEDISEWLAVDGAKGWWCSSSSSSSIASSF